jgi:hypothetical protein
MNSWKEVWVNQQFAREAKKYILLAGDGKCLFYLSLLCNHSVFVDLAGIGCCCQSDLFDVSSRLLSHVLT